MILCPKCKARTNVYDSRISFEGTTRRKRICPGCTFRFATVEVLDEDRPLAKREPAPPKPKKEKLAKPPKRSEVKKPKEEKVRRFDEDDDYYESSTLHEDFAAVAKELGIGDMNDY